MCKNLIAAFVVSSFIFSFSIAQEKQSETEKLTIKWEKNYLMISGDFPGNEVNIHYLEAYCRPGSTDRAWGETVIKHTAELVSVEQDGSVIKIRDTLEDGVIVDHVITADIDSIDFQITATNPTDRISQAHWAQPCIRLDKFTSAGTKDMRERIPSYAHQCFLYIDGKLTMLPTKPWADKARYTYGQVYVPRGVDRNDVNPRPLSELVPSNFLCGCFSKDKKKIFACAFDPCQEIFQGVIACFHNDFRVGGLKAGEIKKIRGKIYIVDNDPVELLKRYNSDFSGKD